MSILAKYSISRKSLLWAVFIAFAWLSAWYLPWQGFIRYFSWFRLGIGILLFILPGSCIYGLLTRQHKFSFSHITFGFVISHLIIALLGTLGRFVHLSSEMVKILTILGGLIFIIPFLFSMMQNDIKINLRSIKIDHILPVFLLLLISGIACLVVIQRVLGDDDLTYLAYLTNWQHSSRMDFNDILFGKPQLVHPRFWIMSAPFAQALLADISKVPGILLLCGYYEPFLVIFAVLGWYELARTLTLSPRAASAASILQLLFLLLLSEYLHPGASFFKQLSTDKATAAFIMAPVFFQSLIRFLKESTKNNLTIFLLTGFSLTFMHPVILAYAIFIGGILVLFNWKKTGISQKVYALAVLALIMIPQVALRFASASSQAEIPYTTDDILSQSGVENMVTRWGDTQFYGFNPAILNMHIPFAENIPPILARGWLVFPILATALALRHAGKSLAAQFLLACFLLGFLAWLPFTGWIIGYFLSAYMLERALWLFPFGLSVVYILLNIRDYIITKQPHKKISWISAHPNILLSIVAIFATGVFLLYIRENNLPDFEKFTDKMQRYDGLATAGQELDRRISDFAFVVGSQQLNDLIPGISAKSKILTFRISQASHMQYFSNMEREERISDTKKIFSKSPSPEEKMLLLEKYDVQFLFLQSFDLRLFEDFIARYPDRVEKIETGGVVILQLKEQGGG